MTTRRTTPRPFLAPLAAAVTLALGAAACSSGGSSPTPSGSGTGALEIMSWWTSASEKPALQVLLDGYTANHPGVQVTDGAIAGGGGSNVLVVLADRLRKGDPPDVWQTFAGASVQTLARQGRVADISGVFSTSGLDSAVPSSVLDAVTRDGKRWGVPTGSHRENVLFFSTAALKKAGVTPPSDGYTLESFRADLARATRAGVPGLCLGGKDAFTSATLFEDILLGTVGPQGWAAVTGDRFDWRGEQAKSALNTFSAALDATDPDAGGMTWDAATKKFAGGGCAFLAFNDSAYAELVADGAKEGRDFGQVTFPGTDPAYLAVLDTFVVGSAAKNAQNGADFLATVASVATQSAFNKVKGSVPVRKDADLAGYSTYQQQAAKAFQAGPVLLSIVHGEAKDAVFQQGFYDAVAAYRSSRNASAFSETLGRAVSGPVAVAP